MEETPPSAILDGEITGIRFSLASRHEICTSSNSGTGITHASQLTNPFLGLPLEHGKCESCGTAEPGKCEGHFGYIELPIPIYHPCHVSELKKILSLLCLKCLKLRTRKGKISGIIEGSLNDASSCCVDTSQITVKEAKTTEGAFYLELKVPTKIMLRDDFWNFLERYGFRYGDNFSRPLLPMEVKEILRRIPDDTRKKLSRKGHFPQDGYIMQHIPVPPNCLSVPDVSDGITVMSSDHSISMLKRVLKQVEIIKSSRSGTPNFESHQVEANDLQAAVAQYLYVRGTGQGSRDKDTRFGVTKESSEPSTKAWLEKMRTLFIRKGSGFSSRSVITGDSYKGVNEIGIPFEIAQRITFEVKVNVHNRDYLQKLVDDKLCLTYKDGESTYSLRESSMGHTFLRPGQVVHRRIMDGDIVFINRPPTTHKHSLQAFSVYVHDDHTVKINPLICGPLSADFDGDCVHLFYPQSLAAKAEVVELFSVDKQLLSSHSGMLNLQLASDSLLSLKILFKNYFLSRAAAHQLAMFVPASLPRPALLKASRGPLWTALQILQTALPANFSCSGERHLIRKSDLLKIDYNRDVVQSLINEIVTSVCFEKSSEAALNFFNTLQPLLMENIFSEGFSVSLEDFFIPWEVLQNIQKNVQDVSPLLHHLRSTYNELVELQLEKHLRLAKVPVSNFILKSSAMGNLIDSKSDSAITKVVQQIGFLGLQLTDRGKFYSKILVEDMASLFQIKYPFDGVDYPSGEFGLVKSCFLNGLDPYEGMVHSISSREVIVRSSRGLTEPGTLFKNLMAILRDVVICYDGTVRNVCSNSIIQFEYGVKSGSKNQNCPAGEPVGVLAATAMSNPAYKAVLDSSPSSNNSWEFMKEILLCKIGFKNDVVDRRVILYLNHCGCGKKYCGENAAYLVKNHLKKVSLQDIAAEFTIEYKGMPLSEHADRGAVLIGHIHLNQMLLKSLNRTVHDVLQKCQETVYSFRKKKKVGIIFKSIELSVSECCSFEQSYESKWSGSPCLMFFLKGTGDENLELTSRILADMICPVLLETVVKGDPRVRTVDITWLSPDTTTWIRSSGKASKGELALDIVLEQTAVKKSGDAWRIVLDSCLPILHLIDTRRSIPYAIKEVQELLGISCAFDQAVQRLSSSVKMVTKGVLKEHLILLANSMTCAGNLVGFNKGGYKALSGSLNIQVPFTEATLFTPRKCFERAAEKHHMDSLSSIVGSCSWGKHVAVGTGSRFDILWDKNAMGMNQEEGEKIDVYSFLHLVRGTSKRDEANTGCLGAEVDDLDLDNYNMDDAPLSPEQQDKPVFEDNMDFENSFDNPMQKMGEASWEKVDGESNGGWNVEKNKNTSDSSGGWNVEKNKNTSESSGGWNLEKNKNGVESNGAWNIDKAKNTIESSGGWNIDKNKSTRESNGVGWNNADKINSTNERTNGGEWTVEKNKKASESGGGWNAEKSKSTRESGGGWNADKNTSINEPSGGWNAEKNKKASESTGGWNADKNRSTNEPSGGWNAEKNKKASESSGGWTADKNRSTNEPSGGWNADKSKSTTESSGGWNADKNTSTNEPSGGWNPDKNKSGNESSGGWNIDRNKSTVEPSGGWNVDRNRSTVEPSGGWNVDRNKSTVEPSGGWNTNRNKSMVEPSGGWNAERNKNTSELSGARKTDSASGWGTGKVQSQNTEVHERSGGWNKAESGKVSNQSAPWRNTNNNDGAKENQSQAEEPGLGAKAAPNEQKKAGDWNKPVKNDQTESSSKGWGSSGELNKARDWNSSSNGGDANESTGKSQWGTQKRELPVKKDDTDSPHGWGSSENAGGSKQSQWQHQQESSSGAWDSPKNATASAKPQWGAKKELPITKGRAESSQAWGSADNAGQSQSQSQSQWGSSRKEDSTTESSPKGWGSSKSQSQELSEPPASSQGGSWGSPKDFNPGGGSNNERGGFPFKRNRPEGSKIWGSNDGDWKNKKSRPGRPPGLPNDDPNFAPMLTVTRQRLDMFTTEEQAILSEVEPIMTSVRRIMYQSGNNDGDPLSTEDQSYIIDNVFNYHPDKAIKMGAGIDHLMVNKHTQFQDSRCLYVVTMEGHKEDFSYLKCLENMVKEKYPDLAEDFNGKYFKKPQPRPRPPPSPSPPPPPPPPPLATPADQEQPQQ